MNDEKISYRKVNRIEELENCYYQIPEYVYYRIPVNYKVGDKFNLKKLPAACISIFIFFSIIKYLSDVSFKIEVFCAMFPLFLITFVIFLNSVLPREPSVTKDSQIVEALVTNVEIYKGYRITSHIATLYVPSVNKEIKINFGQPVTAGRYIVIVRQKNTLTYIKMNDNYTPEDVFWNHD